MELFRRVLLYYSNKDGNPNNSKYISFKPRLNVVAQNS